MAANYPVTSEGEEIKVSRGSPSLQTQDSADENQSFIYESFWSLNTSDSFSLQQSMVV